MATPANGALSGNASWVPVANAGTKGNPPFSTAVAVNGNSPGVTMGAIQAFGSSNTGTFSAARTIGGWVKLSGNNPGDWHDLFGFIGIEGTNGSFFNLESGNGGNYTQTHLRRRYDPESHRREHVALPDSQCRRQRQHRGLFRRPAGWYLAA